MDQPSISCFMNTRLLHIYISNICSLKKKITLCRVDKKDSGYTGPVQCSVLAAMKRDTGRPPIYKKAYDLY